MSATFDLKGKTAVVIGAASGIGEAIAAGFARHRARVIGLDINPDPSRDIGALDITDGPAVDRVLVVELHPVAGVPPAVQLQAAAAEHNWPLKYGDIALLWRGGRLRARSEPARDRAPRQRPRWRDRSDPA